MLGLLSKFVVSTPNEAIQCAILLYQMQNVERLIGSGKFFARLFYSALSTGLLCLTRLNLNLPQVLIFSLLPSFVSLIPPRRKAALGWKFSLSDKVITYAIFASLVSLSPISAGIGTLFGILFHKWDGRLGIFGIEKDQITDPIGATTEIQRKVKAEREEQRLIQQQMARFDQPLRMNPRMMRRPVQPTRAPAPYVPSPVDIASLTQMGFPAERVKKALVDARGDIARAAEQLVQG